MAQTTVALGFVASANEWLESSLAATAETIKASAGTFYLMEVDNTANAAITYVKQYYTNGAVTVGTTVPDQVFAIPASVKLDIIPVGGTAFASGLQTAAVTAGGTAGTTPPVSAVLVKVVYA